jgi:hypothetical protein
MRDFRGPGVDAERLEGFDRSALERPCVRFGVQLDTVGAGRGRQPDGLGRGIDEEADADAQGFQVADDVWQSESLAGVQPAWLVISPGTTGTSVHWSGRTSLTSAISSGRGSPRCCIRPRPKRRQRARDVANVVGCDVPPVGARMHGDSLHASVDARADRVEHTRGTLPPRELRNGGDLVDVDGKANQGASARC